MKQALLVENQAGATLTLGEELKELKFFVLGVAVKSFSVMSILPNESISLSE